MNTKKWLRSFNLGEWGGGSFLISRKMLQFCVLTIEILVMNFWGNLQQKVQKQGGGGGCQIPVGICSEIHPFWRAQASLKSCTDF